MWHSQRVELRTLKPFSTPDAEGRAKKKRAYIHLYKRSVYVPQVRPATIFVTFSVHLQCCLLASIQYCIVYCFRNCVDGLWPQLGHADWSSERWVGEQQREWPQHSKASLVRPCTAASPTPGPLTHRPKDCGTSALNIN